MSYLALARKYRPKKFTDIVGQEHISKTLVNALKSSRIAHAYLFSGPRGVGKTTAARILAKTVNCESQDLENKPCLECPICKDEKLMDIIEIDGASNRGIDEIRELRENVKFTPLNSKYKVYIIDEVHMLTDQAFNALLKTLEEPPAHVIFIFATTELHKIPDTILSRCQKFNFKLITLDDITNRLKHVLDAENIKYELKALNSIARASLGSMRDSLSLLDQVIAYSPDIVTQKETDFILGIINIDLIFEIVGNILDNNTKNIIKIIDNLLKQGFDLSQAMLQLREHYRNLMLLKIDASLSEILDILPEDLSRYEAELSKLSLGKITRDLRIINLAIEDIKRSDYARVICELCLTKLSEPYISSVELLQKLNNLENFEFPMTQKVPEKEYILSTPKVSPEPKLASEQQSEQNFEPKSKPQKIQENDTQNNEKFIEVEGFDSKWNAVLERIKKQKMYLFTYLKEANGIEFKGNNLSLSFATKFYKDGVLKNKEIIENEMLEIFGQKYNVVCEQKIVFEQKKKNEEEPVLNETAKKDIETNEIEENNEDIPFPSDEDLVSTKVEEKIVYSPDEIFEKEPVVKKFVDLFDGELLPH